MKILSREQIQAADKYTIRNEPISSIDLMERASLAFCRAFYEQFPVEQPVMVYCGKGNNGGDGLAISRLLQERGYHTEVYIIEHSGKGSPDFEQNLHRLRQQSASRIQNITKASDFPLHKPGTVCIDAMFGTGLTRPAEGLVGQAIRHINQSGSTIVAVDIPSGLYCDAYHSGENVVQASHTFTFQLPKLSMMLPGTGEYAGELQILDIGLSGEFIELQTALAEYQPTHEPPFRLPGRAKFSHKGTYGHAMIAAGSYGKMGAAVLAVKACLRTGSGLTTAWIPGCGYAILQTACPEAMARTGPDGYRISGEPDLKGISAIGAGPGMGISEEARQFIEFLFRHANCPLVLDADGLNLLAANAKLFAKLPPESILTPHPREFDRLAGKSLNGFERLEKAVQLAKKRKCIIVLKGAYTCIVNSKGYVWFNGSGNAGLATGGTGDVLTGIITSLLAQGLPPETAARFGVWIHGKAGDLAAQAMGKPGMIAGDLLQYIPQVLLLSGDTN